MPVLRDGLQFQLQIARLSGAFDAGVRQSASDAEAPVRLIDADAEFRPVTDLLFAAETFDPRHTDDVAVDFRKDLDLVAALRLFLQKLRFLKRGKVVLFRISQQIVRLRVDQIEIIARSLSVRLCAVAQYAGPAVFQFDLSVVLHRFQTPLLSLCQVHDPPVTQRSQYACDQREQQRDQLMVQAQPEDHDQNDQPHDREHVR